MLLDPIYIFTIETKNQLLGIYIFLVFLSGILIFTFYKTKKRIKILEELAYKDDLTNLKNRKAFMNNLDLKNACSFFIVSLSNFKVFNEIHGSHLSDSYLQLLAKNFFDSTKGENLEIYRFNGDEFIFVVYEHFTKDELLEFARKINEITTESIFINNEKLRVQCNIGIYKYEKENFENNSSTELNVIISNLNSAIRHAKSSTHTNIYIADDGEYIVYRNNKIIESKITTELIKEAVIPYYQPKFNTKTKKIIGAEVLARWNHKETGSLDPELFIPILEKRREIDLLDLLVLEKACVDLKKWIDDGLFEPDCDFRLSFNFSMITIEKNDIYDLLVKLHKKYEIPYSKLDMEITETVFYDDVSHINEKALAVSKLGVKVSLDDFSSGSSNIGQLNKLKVDTIKIDKLIIAQGLTQSTKSIFENLLDLCQRLNIGMVVEGVETEKQADFLSDIGIYNIQGFYFSQPLTANALEKKVKKHKC